MFLKSNLVKTPVFGQAAVDNPVPRLTGREIVTFTGRHDGAPARFGLTREQLDKHLLLLGSTGCGKTTAFLKIANQLQRSMTRDDVMIIFDTKGDFASGVDVSGEKLLLGNSGADRAASVRWNLFREILMDGREDEPVRANTQEICRSLFAEREKRTNNPFFPNAARDLLAAVILSVIRTGYQLDAGFRQRNFNNRALAELLNSRSASDLDYILSFDGDLNSVRSYISGGGEQANGVISEMHSVARDVLTGVFADRGDFSIRDFVRQRGGKTLFIEYDLSLGSTLTPVYRLLIDLALKEALGRRSGRGNVYLVCDEFRLLPHLQHIDDGVNFGRSLGVRVIAGLQSIEQLFEVYQESRGRNIAAGFSNVFAFHSTDPSTLGYLAKAYGQYEALEGRTQAGNRIEHQRRAAPVISDWDLVHLEVGEAFVCPAFGAPFSFVFDK